MPARPRVSWASAAWLGTVCLAGAGYVSALAGAPRIVAQVAGGLSAGATVTFGSRLGRRRQWRRLAIMTVAGTAVVVCSAEAAWAVTLLTPYAGGSGGFLEILAPLFVGVFAAQGWQRSPCCWEPAC